MNLTLKQLETFVLVADLKNFRRVAERLNTTQPNVSSRIAGLERTLGVTLMERDAGSVRLTSRGDALLPYARDVLRSVESLVNAVDEPGLFDDVLHLGVTELVVHTWLPEFLREFKNRFPNTLVELTVDLSAHLEHELAERSIDIAFQNTPFKRSTSHELELGSYPLVWVASPSLNLHAGKREALDIEELAQHPVLTHARNTRSYQDVAKHFAQHTRHKVRMVPSSNLAACIQMTIDGYGIAAIPAAMIVRELAAKKLIKLNYEWTPSSLQFVARYDSSAASVIVQQAAALAVELSAAHAAS